MRSIEVFKEHIDLCQKIIADDVFNAKISEAAEMIVETFRKEGKVFFCGNGGSAADAQHLSAELSGRFYAERPPLNAEALHCNTSYLTAVANDYGFEHVYSRILKGSGKRGDVLVTLSTSGNSENVLKACEMAKEIGIKIISLGGATGGKLKNYSDILLSVPCEDTARIQEFHIIIGHLICEEVEKTLFP